MSTFEEIRSEFEMSSKVKTVARYGFEGICPLQDSGVVHLLTMGDRPGKGAPPWLVVQDYLANKKRPPPWDLHRALDTGLPQGLVT